MWLQSMFWCRCRLPRNCQSMHGICGPNHMVLWQSVGIPYRYVSDRRVSYCFSNQILYIILLTKSKSLLSLKFKMKSILFQRRSRNRSPRWGVAASDDPNAITDTNQVLFVHGMCALWTMVDATPVARR